MGVRNIKKQLAGVEDLLLGEGTEQQERASGIRTITKISSSTLPHKKADGSIETISDSLVSKVTLVADRLALQNLVGTIDGQAVYQTDIALTYTWDSDRDTNEDNGGTIIATTAIIGCWVASYSGAINVRWFGAVGDGVYDNTQVFQNIFSLKDLFLYIPSGNYIIKNALNHTLLSRAEDCIIKGDGEGSTNLHFINTTSGITITTYNSSGQFNRDSQCVIIDGLSILTSNINTGNALAIISPDGLGHTEKQIKLENLAISGLASYANSTWENGIYINASTFSTINKYKFMGNGTNGTGIYFDSVGDAVDNIIHNYKHLGGDTMCKIRGRYEGFYFAHIVGISVQYGIDWQATLNTNETSQPLLSVVQGHINSNICAIKTIDIIQHIISDILFYSLSNTNDSVIDISHPSEDNNQFSQTNINNNIFRSIQNCPAIKLSNNVSGVALSNNFFNGTTTVVTYDDTVKNVAVNSTNIIESVISVLDGVYEGSVTADTREYFLNKHMSSSSGLVTYSTREVVTISGSPSDIIIPIPTPNLFRSKIESVIVSFSGSTNIDENSYVIWNAGNNNGDIDNIHITVVNARTDNTVDVSIIATGR